VTKMMKMFCDHEESHTLDVTKILNIQDKLVKEEGE
jgi:hypothetical protein